MILMSGLNALTVQGGIQGPDAIVSPLDNLPSHPLIGPSDNEVNRRDKVANRDAG